MIRSDEILATIRMFQEENLDVRTVTMGINLAGCVSADVDVFCDKIRRQVARFAGDLVNACNRVSDRYGIPIVNKRIAVSPIASLAANIGHSGLLKIAKTLDEAAAEVRVDLIGGYSALVQKGATPAEQQLIECLPEALSATSRVCASVNVASTKSGINMDAILKLGHVIRRAADLSVEQGGFACAKLCVFANIPEDNPFMAGALHGFGEPEVVLNIGVSGPGVVKRAIERARQLHPDLDLQMLASEIKQTAFRITRVGELVGQEVANELGVEFGVVDLSLAPTPKIGDSIGEILQAMGIEKVGAPGSTAAIALLNEAVKKGGLFASSSVGGLSGAFIPVAEDSTLAHAAEKQWLSLEKLEAMTCVCSLGLDMVCIPGDTDPATISAIMADEMAIGMINHKTVATRLIPVPGKKAGEWVHWGGLFGSSPIMPVRAAGASASFVTLGGRIPAPVSSLRN